jgi:hypothetical protein
VACLLRARRAGWSDRPGHAGPGAAFVPGIPDALDLRLTSIQIEAVLLTLLVFLGVQAAWVVAMTAPQDEADQVT